MEDVDGDNFCPRCMFEGKKSRLSPMKKTDEGFVQVCEKGHTLYVWASLRIIGNLVVDELNKSAASIVNNSNN